MTAKKAATRGNTRTKTPGKSRGVVVKRPQPHGGALITGNPGNVGGWGRPPDELRGLSRDAFHGLVVEIKRRIDDGALKDAELGELATLLGVTGKFGIGEKVVLELASPDVQARLQRQVAVILARAEWPSEALLTALDEVWG